MDQILDKLLLLGFGMVLLLGMRQSTSLVAALLFTIMTASLCFYFQNRMVIHGLFVVIYCVALVLPVLLLFFPIFLYDALSKKIYWAVVIGMLLSLIYPVSQKPEQLMLWGITALSAAVLQYQTQKRNFYQQELVWIRDSSTELNLMLKEKNKSLMEKQDYEIYSATLRERNRIAREIHDNVGHMLSRSLIQIGAMLTIEKEGIIHEQLECMKDTLNEAMSSIRNSVHNLHDESIDLKQAVIEAIKDMQETYEITFDYDMSEHIPKRVKYCFISTIKEAVSNVIRHSNGDSVRIILREHPAFYQLSFQDNGTISHVDMEHGIGLKNMKERVDMLHGTLHIRTENGFLLFISIQKTEEILCE